MKKANDLFRGETQKDKEKSEPGKTTRKKRVLFICTGNSVRSQMAEALLRAHGGDKFEVFSAGITPAGVHRLTKQVMSEVGISMEGHYSQYVGEYAETSFDYVIPLCEVAALSCPNFPGDYKTINWFIDDPIRVFGDEERKLMAFRITRNIIEKKVLEFIEKNSK